MCSTYQTTELPQESASQAQRHAALIVKNPQLVTGPQYLQHAKDKEA